MGILESSMPLCPSNQHCSQWARKYMKYFLCSVKDGASFTLGIISVLSWTVAEIPQLITNYREKSAEGLSIAFLMTWIAGDLFNLFGCILEPATLPTQFYTALLYTITTLVLTSQTIYYGHIYPQLKYNRQLQVETTEAGQNNNGWKQATNANHSNGLDTFNGGSLPIPIPAVPQKINTRKELFYRSARFLSKSHAPSAGSILPQRTTSTSHILNALDEPLLGSSVSTQSAPALKINTTLCLASIWTLFGAFNLLHSVDRRLDSIVIKPKKEFVIQLGRKLLQVHRVQLPEHGTADGSGIGSFLGWGMAAIYMGGRLPQICLNIKRGTVDGLNPLLFLFALVGNGSYVASILVSSVDWSKIRPNLPWLVESGGCVLLDFFILMQFIYFRCRYRNSQDVKGEKQHQIVA